jgi:hypothetical protein
MKINLRILVPLCSLLLFWAAWPIAGTNVLAAGEARIRAESLTLEETEEGALLTLEGPVEVVFEGDTLAAQSAKVVLRADADNLADALVSIELSGGASLVASDGAVAGAAGAVFIAVERRLVLRGGASFDQGGLTASAGSCEYSIPKRIVTFIGGCRFSEGDVSGSCDSAEYDLNTRSGALSGSVVVRYRSGEVFFADEPVDEIIMRAPTLHISVLEGEVRTGRAESGERTAMQAGEYSLEADRVIFHATDNGLSEVSAEGDIRVEGPRRLRVRADKASLSTVDRILRVEGDVSFSVLNQQGTAEALEVNFAEGWSVRLTGASVGGAIEEAFEDDSGASEGQ